MSDSAPAKTCNKCLESKPTSNFYAKKNGRFGVQAVCKECIKINSLNCFKRNRDSRLESMREYRKNNTEYLRFYDRNRYYFNTEERRKYVKLWLANNPEKASEAQRNWAKANKHKKYAIVAKRRAAKLSACPKWLSESQLLEIVEIYKNCPKGWHVDHEIPLQGKNVCGLHVPWNLKAIPAQKNLSKGNKIKKVD